MITNKWGIVFWTKKFGYDCYKEVGFWTDTKLETSFSNNEVYQLNLMNKEKIWDNLFDK